MIYLGSDHGGFSLKEKIKEWLKEWEYEYKDLGNTEFDKDDDYPDYAIPVAEKVGSGDDRTLDWKDRPKGILACRSAGGVIVAANKVKNVSAIAIFDNKSAEHARLHNDANVIALSGDWTDEETAKEIIEVWLETEFSHEERHNRRINKIKDYESKQG